MAWHLHNFTVLVSINMNVAFVCLNWASYGRNITSLILLYMILICRLGEVFDDAPGKSCGATILMTLSPHKMYTIYIASIGLALHNKNWNYKSSKKCLVPTLIVQQGKKYCLLNIFSYDALEELPVVPRGISFHHLVQGLVIAIQEGFLDLHQVNLV